MLLCCMCDRDLETIGELTLLSSQCHVRDLYSLQDLDLFKCSYNALIIILQFFVLQAMFCACMNTNVLGY